MNKNYLNKITNADCFEHLPLLQNESIDLFLSDIPYGIGLDNWDVLHNNTNSAYLGRSPAQEGKSGFKRRGKPINGWSSADRNIGKEYQEWCSKWSSMVFPKMKEGASAFVFGARRTIDGESYCNRFTPRKAKSIWSAVNIAKVAELTKLGLMKPAGITAFAKREESKSKIYAYENEPVKLSVEFETKFKANDKAWTFFEKQPNGYKKIVTNWVMSAKQDLTRQNRLEKLIKESEDGKRI